MKQKLKKFYYKYILRKKYIRTGSCLKCGQCCQNIYIKHDRKVLKDEQEYYNLNQKGKYLDFEIIDKVIKSGQALKKLEAMLEAHGGDASSLHDISKLVPKANEIFVSADKSGYIFDIDTKKLYEAINYIGSDGGKTVNPNVGVEVMVREGDKVMAGDKLAKIYYSISDPSFATAVQFIRGCFEIKKVKPELENLIYKVIV